MDTIKLNNGYEIPIIGYGTFPQKESLPDNIVNAFQAEYRMFDTSDNYNNESYAGEGLKRIDTNQCVVISKYSRPGNEKRFEGAFTDSLKNLGVINVYLLHWPYPFLWKYQWKQAEKLYIDGKVNAIGVCNFEIKRLKEILRFCKVTPMINQIERHPLFQQNEIVYFCKENNIQIMCYSPVARADDELMNNPLLMNLANKYNKTVSQIILRWDIDTGTIPIPASSSKQHIEENISVFDFKLTKDEIDQINLLDAGKRIRFDPKKRFTYKQKFHFLLSRLKLMIHHKKE